MFKLKGKGILAYLTELSNYCKKVTAEDNRQSIIDLGLPDIEFQMLMKMLSSAEKDLNLMDAFCIKNFCASASSPQKSEIELNEGEKKVNQARKKNDFELAVELYEAKEFSAACIVFDAILQKSNVAPFIRLGCHVKKFSCIVQQGKSHKDLHDTICSCAYEVRTIMKSGFFDEVFEIFSRKFSELHEIEQAYLKAIFGRGKFKDDDKVPLLDVMKYRKSEFGMNEEDFTIVIESFFEKNHQELNAVESLSLDLCAKDFKSAMKLFSKGSYNEALILFERILAQNSLMLPVDVRLQCALKVVACRSILYPNQSLEKHKIACVKIANINNHELLIAALLKDKENLHEVEKNLLLGWKVLPDNLKTEEIHDYVSKGPEKFAETLHLKNSSVIEKAKVKETARSTRTLTSDAIRSVVSEKPRRKVKSKSDHGLGDGRKIAPNEVDTAVFEGDPVARTNEHIKTALGFYRKAGFVKASNEFNEAIRSHEGCEVGNTVIQLCYTWCLLSTRLPENVSKAWSIFDGYEKSM